MPAISDPGAVIVAAAVAAGVRVVPVPGPCAAIAALAAAGLPTDSFYFAGFLPPKNAKRREALQQVGVTPPSGRQGPGAPMCEGTGQGLDRPACRQSCRSCSNVGVHTSLPSSDSGSSSSAASVNCMLAVISGPAVIQHVLPPRLSVAPIMPHCPTDSTCMCALVAVRSSCSSCRRRWCFTRHLMA